VRLRKTLVDQRTAWQQRIHAQLFHHGFPRSSGLLVPAQRARLAALELPPAARTQIEAAYSLIDAITAQLVPLEAQLRSFAKAQAGCRALMEHFGIGELTSVTILAELGDARRFSSSRHAVRFAGLDVTVSESDERRAPGRLSHQGSPILRWALFEAAQCACRPGSPDHDYYRQTSARLNHKRAALSVARKLARRAHHTLRELGGEALLPAEGTV
jgi:transposase